MTATGLRCYLCQNNKHNVSLTLTAGAWQWKTMNIDYKWSFSISLSNKKKAWDSNPYNFCFFLPLPPPPPPASSVQQLEIFIYNDFWTLILTTHAFETVMKRENSHTNENMELLNCYTGVPISPHTQGQIFEELHIKTPHTSANHIHGPQIFQKKTVSILHVSAIYFPLSSPWYKFVCTIFCTNLVLINPYLHCFLCAELAEFALSGILF
jgi:hypothetical protein